MRALERRVGWMLALSAGAVGCATLFSPIPRDAVLAAAEPLCNLGHPGGTFVDARIVGSATGACTGGGSHDRYVDVDIHYQRKAKDHTMRVRFYLHEVEPCHITTDVLQDDGPPPLLLDNGIASQAVGEELCRALADHKGQQGR